MAETEKDKVPNEERLRYFHDKMKNRVLDYLVEKLGGTPLYATFNNVTGAEESIIITRKDSGGNIVVQYPKTTAENVEGLTDIIEENSTKLVRW